MKFTGKEFFIPKAAFVLQNKTEFGVITEIDGDYATIGNCLWYHFPIQREICLCQLHAEIKEEKQESCKTKQEFIEKYTAVVVPPKENTAIKNQAGSLNMNITLKNNLTVIKNTPRKRKSGRRICDPLQQMIQFIEGK